MNGHRAVVEAYRQQFSLAKPIYFIRSLSDIPIMGYNVMHEIRTTPARENIERFGITPDNFKGPADPKVDKKNKLTRTWVKEEDYLSQVEWSICGSSLLIVIFDQEPQAITITNQFIADSFLQLWKLLSSTLRAMPYYQELPRVVN